MAPTLKPQTLNPNPNSNNLPIEAVRQIRKELRKKHKERKRQKNLQEILENQLQTILLEKPKPSNRSPPSKDYVWKFKHDCVSSPSRYEWFPKFTPGPEPKPWPLASDPEPNLSPRASDAEPSTPPWISVNVIPKPERVEKATFLTTNKVQRMCLEKCKEFLTENDDDDEESMEESVEFFRGLFADDVALKGYYEKSWKNGGFVCLVCEGVGEKVGKVYRDCVGVVQHAINVGKSKRVYAHRAYGVVVCEVLNWNVDRLPAVGDWKGYTDEVEMDEADDDADTT